MKIQKLPAEARSKLQSGILVTDAIQCVLELVHNALDAEATGIAVRVDLKTYQIRVIDNGKGIGKDDLEFVGERYMTSKYHSFIEAETYFRTYGFRGQALSSVLDVSGALTIETKSADGGQTFIKAFQNKKALPITETENDRSGTGTIVTVDDFMCTMPVRRKRISEVFDLEEIKTQLQYLALIHYNVCFTLRNESKGLILLQTPQASSILESVSNIYGKAVAKSMKPLYYEEKKYEVTGFISLKTQNQSNVQLLYINKRIISKGLIHKFVNSLLKEYSGKKGSVEDSPTDHILRKLRFSHSIFIIQINCPQSFYELFTNIRKVTVEFKNWKDPLKCIHKATKRALKDVLNFESSSIPRRDENKEKEDDNKQGKGVFGTSLLVNAVRGIAVKRHPKAKGVRDRSKTKMSDKKNELLSKKSRNLDKSEDALGNLNRSIQKNEISDDSLESPIPKKTVKNTKQVCLSKIQKTDINQSFIEFYEWLKAKFETDIKAFNLYNDFVEFKNKPKINSKEDTIFRSPVLGGNRKRKQAPVLRKKILEKKPKTPLNDLSFLDEEMAIMTQRQLKIFPNQDLRMKKAVQFTAEMSPVSKSLNVCCVRNETFEFPNNQLFDKRDCSSFILRRERQDECNHTVQSLPSSEMQFTNVIKFRNLADSFFHPSSTCRLMPEKTFSASNTWMSHYQGSKKVCEKDRNKGSYVSWMDGKGAEAVRGNKNLQDFDCLTACEPGLIDFDNNRKKAVKDVEIQVNILSLPIQKVNVMVQTLQQVPESPSFENSDMLSVARETTENIPDNAEEQQFSNNNISQEVPNFDFWNTTNHMEFEVKSQHEGIMKEVTLNKSSNDINDKKNLTSNEFVCGHKSQLSTKVESTLKETQTLAAIWTDSLTELGYPTENVNAIAVNLTSKSEQLSDPNAIPKTIPLSEINIAESGFCITERHDFIPKGLSPKFLNPLTTTVASLSPSEKCKIQSTIDSTQNEFLANIKWQNESTGDLVKPVIPDGIIFEMRQKAGENSINYENPVLSATLSYCAIKVHHLLRSFAFTKELISGVEVLGQLDKKFIVTRMKISTPKKMELISLFDQHAADERIKLEELINENISSNGKFVSSRLNHPVECTLTESDVRRVSDLKEKMLNYGLNAEAVNGNVVVVNEVPTFMLKKYENDPKNKKDISLSDAVRALILNIIEEVTETRGAVSRIPKVIHNAFCLEACHKAIKFNKPLSIENMTEMITKLQSCKLPFQCAHGRPSVIPIIDLEDFKSAMEETETPDFEKLRKFLSEREDSIIKYSKPA